MARDDYGNMFSKAFDATGGGEFSGTLGSTRDIDVFQFNLANAQEVQLKVNGNGFNLDTILTVYDASGTIVDFNDDSSSAGTPNGSYLDLTLSGGTYYAVVSGYSNFADDTHTSSIHHNGIPSGPYFLGGSGNATGDYLFDLLV